MKLMKPRLLLLLVNLALLAAWLGRCQSRTTPGPTGARNTTATLGRLCAQLRH